MKKSRQLTLAIEAAVSGGSLSLIGEGAEVANWIGISNMAKAEALLADIDLLLRDNGYTVSDLGLIAVSAGPGSFTGIRIGIATALGLSTGLGIQMASESGLVAMANRYRGHADLVAAVPAGRESVCFQIFDTLDGVMEKSKPRTDPEDAFLSLITNGEKTYVLHDDLFKKANSQPGVMNFGRNIALAIGEVCAVQPRPKSEPLFVSKSQ
jgi:tRNA threonylcarbamoyladenosine biosynthesis protein TsaB